MKRRNCLHRSRVIGLLVPLVCSARASGQTYRVTDLGTLGGSGSTATAINASGQVVGYSDGPAGSAGHAFLYSSGQMKDLGTLGGESYAYGINSTGQVTGEYASGWDPFYGTLHTAFRYSNGTMTN